METIDNISLEQDAERPMALEEPAAAGGLAAHPRELEVARNPGDDDDTTPLDKDDDPPTPSGYVSTEDLLDKTDEPTVEDLDDEGLRRMEADAAGLTDYYSVEILDHIRRGAGRSKLLSPAREVKLAKSVERGDMAAKAEMINSNQRLVISIAKNFQGQGVPLEDLIQEGTLGLIRAVEKFDWRKGFKFSTYATWWIRQACQRTIANQGHTIRPPVHVVERQYKIAKETTRLVVELGRDPTREELAEASGLPINHVNEALDAARVSVSLNQKVGEDDEGEFGDLIADQGAADPEEEAEESLRRQVVRRSLDALPERERWILELRYGFHGKPTTLEAIGKQLGLTRERVRQLEQQALRRLEAFKEFQSVTDSIPRSEEASDGEE